MGIISAFRDNVRAVFVRPGEKIAHIDGIRAIACISIVLYHSFFLYYLLVPEAEFNRFVKNTPPGISWIWGLDKSVDAFFVISGFLIGGILLREYNRSGSLNLGSFYWRRYLRLTPVYLFAILVYCLLAPELSGTIWANLLYVNNFLPFGEMSMPWTWSLAVEEQFYLLFPPLLLLVLRYWPALWVLPGLFALSFVFIALVASRDPVLWNSPYHVLFSSKDNIVHYYDTLYVNLYTRFGPLICGAFVACLVTQKARWVQRLMQKALLVDVITVLVLVQMAAGLWLNGNKELLGDNINLSRLLLVCDKNLFGVGMAWLILACAGSGRVSSLLNAGLSARMWYPFAQLSYSMYLLHFMVIVPVLHLVLLNAKAYVGDATSIGYGWYWLTFGVTLLICIPLCFLCYVLIEKPFINFRGVPSAWLQRKLSLELV